MACVTSHISDPCQRQMQDNFGNYNLIRKCGEIFYHKTDTNLTITFHCVICKLIYYQLEDFVEHIKRIECNNDSSNEENENILNKSANDNKAKALFINKKYNSDTEEFDDKVNVIQNLSEKSSSSMDYNTTYIESTTTIYCDDYSDQSVDTSTEFWNTSKDIQSIISLPLRKNSIRKHYPKMSKSKCNSYLHMYSHDNNNIGTYAACEIKSKKLSNLVVKNVDEDCPIKTQVVKSMNDKIIGRCDDCIFSESISSLNEYSSSENNLFCKLCDRYFQKRYQMKIHKMIAHKDFPRVIDSSPKLSYQIKTTCDDIAYSDIEQIIVPSIKNFQRRKKKNLNVKFVEPIMLNIKHIE